MISMNLTGTKILSTAMFNPFRSKNVRLMITNIFARRKKARGIGGRPKICCFLMIDRPITNDIKEIKEAEIIKTIVEIISINF